MSRVGVDLDGVCYDFAASLRYFLCATAARTPEECPEATRWEFYEDWGYSLSEFLEWCRLGTEAGVIFTHGEPYPGTVAALETLAHRGHTLHVITDRSFGSNGASERATRAWLDRHELPFHSLTFSPDKTIVRTDYMIDDKLANYDALDAAGTKVFLLDRPWNQDDGTRRRVASLAEFVEVVA